MEKLANGKPPSQPRVEENGQEEQDETVDLLSDDEEEIAREEEQGDKGPETQVEQNVEHESTADEEETEEEALDLSLSKDEA